MITYISAVEVSVTVSRFHANLLAYNLFCTLHTKIGTVNALTS